MADNNQPAFSVTLFTNGSGLLTKELKMEHGKIISVAPKLFSGIANRVELTLPELPDFIERLSQNQCFTPGIMDTDERRVEVITTKEFQKRGFTYPVTKDETGIYGTRSSLSMTHKGPSLILFDYDPDPSAEQVVDCPEKFLELLDRAVPELKLKDIDYVRTYSTSTSLYEKNTHKEIRPANGFHIYMVVAEGADIKRFGRTLEKRCWLAGLGHVKVSASGARLFRTIFDAAVHQPERLCFESGAAINPNENFYQKLPKGEVNLRNRRVLETRDLRNLSPEHEKLFTNIQDAARESDLVMQTVAKYRENRIQRLVNTTHYTNKPLRRKEAEKIVEAHESHILHPMDKLEFEDGRVTTVLEAFLNATNYDGAQLKDPLRPEKGYSKAKFYANLTQFGDYHPRINSFVEGGRQFVLRETMDKFMSTVEETESQLEEFDTKSQVMDVQYLPALRIQPGVTLIKSEKGTGKTTAISSAVKGDNSRTISISHLISLVSAISKKFGLADYNEIESENINQLRLQRHLGICLNSLYKLAGQTYDTVILDEVCQLLRALKAGTVDKPAACLKVLREIIQGAKYVIAMDADLNKEFVEMMQSPEYGILPEDAVFHVVINKYQPAKAQGRHVTFYQNENERPDHTAFNQQLLESARETGLFYASNSKKDVIAKAAMLIHDFGGDFELEQEHFITECPNGRRVITITSNNSQTPEVQELIKDLNQSLRDDDILLSSPSMGTGHSIDAIEGKARFARTFGYFTKMAGNLPSDCLQHLSRVRECKEFHVVYVDNSRQYETVPINIVQREVYGNKNTIDNKLRVTHMSEYDMATATLKINDHGWANWYGQLKAFEHVRLNAFGKFLVAGFEAEGYEVETEYQEATKEGAQLKDLLKSLNENLSEIEKQKLRETELITDEEFDTLENQIVKTADERRQLYKKRWSMVFGILNDGDELNDLITSSTNSLNSRRKGLLLSADNDDLFLLDIMNRVNKKRTDKEKTAYSEHQALLRGFLTCFGVSFPDNIPYYDGREITELMKLQAFQFLQNNSRDLEVLHHLTVPSTKEESKKVQFVSLVLRSIGLIYKRKRARNIFGGLDSIHYLDDERFSRLVEDGLRARKFAKTNIFTGVDDLPGNLKAYTFQWLAGTPHISELNPYVSKLDIQTQEKLHSILKNKLMNNQTLVA